MKTMCVLLCTILATAGLSLLSFPTTARAADEDQGDRAPVQRLERLEKQVHELAEREEHANQRPGPMMQTPRGPKNPQEMMPFDGRRPFKYPHRWHYPGVCILGTLLVVMVIVHILLAIWVFGDIRKRGEGSGIFIVLALLIGAIGAALYLLARIGDRKAT
jgi:hypothetical protein